jgi:hypothetical protein
MPSIEKRVAQRRTRLAGVSTPEAHTTKSARDNDARLAAAASIVAGATRDRRYPSPALKRGWPASLPRLTIVVPSDAGVQNAGVQNAGVVEHLSYFVTSPRFELPSIGKTESRQRRQEPSPAFQRRVDVQTLSRRVSDARTNDPLASLTRREAWQLAVPGVEMPG